MILNVKLKVSNQRLNVGFSSTAQIIQGKFHNAVRVEIPSIPKEYGLVTYNQDRTLTIT